MLTSFCNDEMVPSASRTPPDSEFRRDWILSAREIMNDDYTNTEDELWGVVHTHGINVIGD